MEIYVKNRKGKKIFCEVERAADFGDRLPAVLIVHGFKGWSAQRHISAISNALVARGFLTVRADLTGNPGKSYLDFADMTYAQELSDCEDVLDHILRLSQIDAARIGITGHSLGGMIAAEIAAKRGEIKSLVVLSAVYDFKFVVKRIFNKPFKQVQKDFREKGASFVWSQGLHKELVIKQGFYQDVVLRTAADFAPKIICPTLVVSSGNDESVSQSHAGKYLKTLGSGVKKMEIVDGADHNYSGVSLNQVTGLVKEWFMQTL